MLFGAGWHLGGGVLGEMRGIALVSVRLGDPQRLHGGGSGSGYIVEMPLCFLLHIHSENGKLLDHWWRHQLFGIFR